MAFVSGIFVYAAYDQVGALISRKVPPTKTEKLMRRRLAEMQEESEE